jgi:hypothetical protein
MGFTGIEAWCRGNLRLPLHATRAFRASLCTRKSIDNTLSVEALEPKNECNYASGEQKHKLTGCVQRRYARRVPGTYYLFWTLPAMTLH